MATLSVRPIALFLPEAKDPSAIIEMLSMHGEKRTRQTEPAWFYKMYGSDPALRGQVDWSKNDRTLSFSMKNAVGFHSELPSES